MDMQQAKAHAAEMLRLHESIRRLTADCKALEEALEEGHAENDRLREENKALREFLFKRDQTVEIGRRMRAAQNEYFKTRNRDKLIECKQLERQFDEAIDAGAA